MLTAADLARVHDLVRAEPALASFAGSGPRSMPWGSGSVHLTGNWADAGVEVLVKVGASPAQVAWTRELAGSEPSLVPRVFAGGLRLAGADLGWLVLERLPHGLDGGWGGAESTALVDAGVRFQRAARDVRLAAGDLTRDQVRDWIVLARDRGAPGPVDVLLSRLDVDWELLVEICPPEVCHGDLHLANALVRAPAPVRSPAVLVDCEPSRMSWVVEAAYAQVLNSDPARPGWRDLAGLMAGRRRVQGLAVGRDADVQRAAATALAWNALRLWGVLGPVPDPGWRAAAVWEEWTRNYVDAGVSV